MNYFVFVFFSLFGITFSTAQEDADSSEYYDEDHEYVYEQVKIDSIFSIQLPTDFFTSTDEEEDMHSDYWYGYGENDITFIVHRARIDERICISTKIEMDVYYDESIDGWKEDDSTLIELINKRYNNYGVYLTEFSYKQYDTDLEEMYHNDYRVIFIKDTFYQIGITQPLASKNTSRNNEFFESITISDDYTKKNQYTDCNTLDILFGNDDDDYTGNSSYDNGYALGKFMGGFICIGGFIAVFVLVIILMVRTNRKNKQKEWEQFNN